MTVHRYLSGKQIPERRIMIAIFLLTGGQVTPNDFYDLPELQMDLPLGGGQRVAA